MKKKVTKKRKSKKRKRTENMDLEGQRSPSLMKKSKEKDDLSNSVEEGIFIDSNKMGPKNEKPSDKTSDSDAISDN